VKYEVTSDRAQSVDGLGVFAEGETRTFDADTAQGFRRLHGVSLLNGNVPDGIKVTIVVGGEE